MSRKRALFVTMIIALTFIQCTSNRYNQQPFIENIPNYQVVEVEGCEYIYSEYHSRIIHKGNCKYCEERRKQELNEIKQLIRELKEN